MSDISEKVKALIVDKLGIDENEVTLKKFRSFKNSIALEPANKNYKIRLFGEDRVKIQGKLVGLIRKF